MKFKLIVLIGVFIASTGFNGTETERMVTGAVTDGRVPLPGVSVYVKGTSLGTITDKKGHYSIEVKDDKAVLVFSFIGFETREVRVGRLDERRVGTAWVRTCRYRWWQSHYK